MNFINKKLKIEKEEILKNIQELFPKYSDINLENIKIKMHNEGSTNELYRIEIKEKEIFHFNLRINGIGTDNIIDREREEKIMREISKYGHGPIIYGTYLNGSIYEYFEGYPLTSDDIKTDKFMKEIAKEMYDFHSLKIEIIPKETEIYSTLRKWYSFIENKENEYLKKEIEWLEEQTKDFWIGLCHNDLQSRNIIYNPKLDSVKFIDYEYCFYNFRAFDIANHFCEYQDFELDISKFPKKENQMEYLKYYLENDSFNIDTLYHQVQICILLSNLLWSIWAIFQSKNSKIQTFDYLSYSKKRLSIYFNLKK